MVPTCWRDGWAWPRGRSNVTRLTRRGFLVLSTTGAAGAVLAGYLAGRTPETDPTSGTGPTPTSTTVAGRQTAGSKAPAGNRWSDPASWSNGAPGRNQVAVVPKPI